MPNQTNESPWGADCPISMPHPTIDADTGPMIDFGGFAFTTRGLTHNLTDVDRDAILAEGYGPGAGPNG